jgi:hypothetical protein
MAVLNVISHIVECLYMLSVNMFQARPSVRPTLVFCIRRTRGDSVRATRDVEKSISRLETSPSFDSDCLLKGSVVYIL